MFNIYNNNMRKVRCIKNTLSEGARCADNLHLLEVGKEYTVEEVEVHSWHTAVYLVEFRGLPFNSVVFEELDNREKAVKWCHQCHNQHDCTYIEEFINDDEEEYCPEYA